MKEARHIKSRAFLLKHTGKMEAAHYIVRR
jgi:hypothetical protein